MTLNFGDQQTFGIGGLGGESLSLSALSPLQRITLVCDIYNPGYGLRSTWVLYTYQV